jgi:Foot protein 3
MKLISTLLLGASVVLASPADATTDNTVAPPPRYGERGWERGERGWGRGERGWERGWGTFTPRFISLIPLANTIFRT